MNNEQLVARIRAGENEADNMLELWQNNRAFVAVLAGKYSGLAEREDLMQEGYIGLCEAVRHYKDEGVPFINYAAFWIKNQMRRYAANCCGPVRISGDMQNLVGAYGKIRREYAAYYGHEPSEFELCGLLGINREKLENVRKAEALRHTDSLERPLPGTDGLTVAESVSSDEDMEEYVARSLDSEKMSREVWLAVDELPGEQKEAVRLRFLEGATLKELGGALGVSVERARRIQGSAMRSLRQKSGRYCYKHYYEEYLAAAPVHHVGLDSFRSTWYSEVEREVLGWDC